MSPYTLPGLAVLNQRAIEQLSGQLCQPLAVAFTQRLAQLMRQGGLDPTNTRRQ
jgi:hypothetical protein